MARTATAITARVFIGGTAYDDLTEAEKANAAVRIRENIGRCMNEYFREAPESYGRFLRENDTETMLDGRT